MATETELSQLTRLGPEQYWGERWRKMETGWRGLENGTGEGYTDQVFRNNFVYLSGRPQQQPALQQSDRGAHRLRVLVPLCGDSPVLRYLFSQLHRDFPTIASSFHGVDVVGIDIAKESLARVRDAFPSGAFSSTSIPGADASELAKKYVVEQSFDEHNMRNTLTLLEGDFFRIMTSYLGEGIACGEHAPFDLIYDRAAFVAVAPSLRADYAKNVSRVMRAAGESVCPESGVATPLLLIELMIRKPEARLNADGTPRGPPFHVDAEELLKFFTPESGFATPYVSIPHPPVVETFLASSPEVAKMPFRPHYVALFRQHVNGVLSPRSMLRRL